MESQFESPLRESSAPSQLLWWWWWEKRENGDESLELAAKKMQTLGTPEPVQTSALALGGETQLRALGRYQIGRFKAAQGGESKHN